MKKSAILLGGISAVFCFWPLRTVFADKDSATQFSLHIQEERRQFEDSMKLSGSDPRLAEDQQYRKQKVQDKIAFDQTLEGMTLDEKSQAIQDYQQKINNDQAAHFDRLKKLEEDQGKRRVKRDEFENKIAQEVNDFNQSGS